MVALTDPVGLLDKTSAALSTLVPIVALVVNAALAIGVWMWKRSMESADLKNRIDGVTPLSVQIQQLTDSHASMTDEIARLHEKASDYNDVLTKKLGVMDTDMRLALSMIAERDIRELRQSVALIREGQTEWHRTIRHRTHDLAGFMNVLVLRLTLLERGVPSERPIRPFEFAQPLSDDNDS